MRLPFGRRLRLDVFKYKWHWACTATLLEPRAPPSRIARGARLWGDIGLRSGRVVTSLPLEQSPPTNPDGGPGSA